MSFGGTQQKSKACDKTVHFIDQLFADGVTYHRPCFKCSHCNGQLSMSSYSSMDAVLYCKLISSNSSGSPEIYLRNIHTNVQSLHQNCVYLRRLSCFRCNPGGCFLSPSNCAALDGILYCKHHFAQLFKEKGSYNHLTKTASLKKNGAPMPEMKPEEADSEKAQEVAEEPKQEAEAGEAEAEPAQDSAPQEQSGKCAPPNAMFH